MSDFKVGDKVRLNDKGFQVLPRPGSREETAAQLGVLTVSDVVSAPTDEDPESQALWFEEMEWTVPSAGVDRE